MAEPDISEGQLIGKAQTLILAGESRHLPLRLLGGLAVRITSPSASTHPNLRRTYADVDLVGLSRDASQYKELFTTQGYEADVRFNALHGQTRLIFYDQESGKHIDVFLDQFKMCHAINLRERLFPGYQTLSLADLLLTKMQIIELNAKDMKDILALLLDHDVRSGERAGLIDVDYMARLSGEDWGLHTTISDNLEKTCSSAVELLDAGDAARVCERAEVIRAAFAGAPKSLRWRLRAKIGRRMEWYELPDEVNR